MIAAVASVFITPWNLFNNPAMIHNTLDILACAIGPLYGILLIDYYRLKKQKDDRSGSLYDVAIGRLLV
jgi:nucleobase:cation symporter-1, NCS1 family